jgi:hypothetical protein
MYKSVLREKVPPNGTVLSNVLKISARSQADPQPAHPQSQPRSEQDRLEAGLIRLSLLAAATGRDAVKALIVANGFLEAEVEEIRADVSKGYARG